MRKENFNLLFAKRSRLLKSGEAAIFMRITANGTRVECNTGKSIEPHLWNQAKERVKAPCYSHHNNCFSIQSYCKFLRPSRLNATL